MHKEAFIDNLYLFPHIQRRLEAIWGTPECRSYLVGLMRQSDRESREGFPPHVFRTLFDIYSLHDYEYPEFIPKNTPWDYA